MSLSLLGEIILREVVDPDFQTKNDDLTWGELDGNIVILADAIRELSEVEISGIEAYNPATEYSNGDYVTYNNNTWQYIYPTPATGQTPSNSSIYWEIRSQGLFSHVQNTDTKLAEGTSDEVTAAEIRAFIDLGQYDDTPVLYKDGSRSMTGDLNMGGNDLGSVGEVRVTGTNGFQIGDKAGAGGYQRIVYNDANNIFLFLTESDTGATCNYGGLAITDSFPKAVNGNSLYVKDNVGIGEDPVDSTRLLLTESTTDYSSLRVLSGTAPTSPIDGDVWYDTRLKFRDGTTTETIAYLSDITGLSDGDKGDITVSSSGTVWTIDDGVVTAAKLASLTSAELAGKVSDETGTGSLVFASGPTLTGSVVINTSGTLTVASDTDVTTILGRVKLGSPTTDIAYFAHFDKLDTTNFALSQNSSGATILNAQTSVNIAFQAGTIINVGNSGVTVTDGKNFIFSSTTGTKFGTATTQKLALWNATPIAQPSSTGEATGFTAGAGSAVDHLATFTGNVGTKAYTINDIVKHLKNIGALAAS
jgi:hypothetical protein